MTALVSFGAATPADCVHRIISQFRVDFRAGRRPSPKQNRFGLLKQNVIRQAVRPTAIVIRRFRCFMAIIFKNGTAYQKPNRASRVSNGYFLTTRSFRKLCGSFRAGDESRNVTVAVLLLFSTRPASAGAALLNHGESAEAPSNW